MAKIKISEIRKMSDKDREKKLKELKTKDTLKMIVYAGKKY